MRARRAGVFVVGSLNADLRVSVQRRPVPGETVLATGTLQRPGGKGANQAVAAARLGGAVAILGRVGADDHGAMLTAALRAEGVDTDRVLQCPEDPTGRAFITVTPDGENEIIVDPGANARLGPADVDAAGDAIAAAGVVVCQLEVPAAAVTRAMRLGAAAGAQVVLNLSPLTDIERDALADVSVLVVNEHEAGGLLGTALNDLEDALQRAGDLLALGPRRAVITLGATGAIAVGDDGPVEHVAAPRVRPVDTTGAGDAFVGALAVALGAGASLHDATAEAVAAGTAATLGEGAQSALPRPQQVAALRRQTPS